MKLRDFEIKGPLLIEPKRHYDMRGFSCETYNAAALAQYGVMADFPHEILSFSTASGTVHGLHFQRPPHPQHKLFRVIRGAIFAVAVDLRGESPSFGRHVSVELSAEDSLQLLVPAGFAAGYATLRPLTEIVCRKSAPDEADCSDGIYWDDPQLRIAWPVSADQAVLSPWDEALPVLKQIETPFRGEEGKSGVAA